MDGEGEISQRSMVDLVPRPDPTKLTTEQLRQEIKALREIIEARMDGADELYKILKERVASKSTELDSSITHLRELVESNLATLQRVTDEKFARIETQFNERDTRTDQRAGDTKLAVDAAFAAAKEATAKIEAGFTKQIDSMAGTVDTKTQNLDGRLADLKDRVTAQENRRGSDVWGFLVGAVGLVIGILGGIGLIVRIFSH